jgi:hypothetical protein
MNKPNNFEETQAGGDYIPVELGGHYAVIKDVAEMETKNGDPMVIVSIDFDNRDSQPGYFMDAFKKDIRPDKKWPNQAKNYITTEYNGTCTKGFKGFICQCRIALKILSNNRNIIGCFNHRNRRLILR